LFDAAFRETTRKHKIVTDDEESKDYNLNVPSLWVFVGLWVSVFVKIVEQQKCGHLNCK